MCLSLGWAARRLNSGLFGGALVTLRDVMRLRRHLEHPLQDLIPRPIRGRIIWTLILHFPQYFNCFPEQQRTLAPESRFAPSWPCQWHGVSHPAKGRNTAPIPSWRSHPVGRGPTTPAFIAGAWSKSRPGPSRAVFVLLGQSVPESGTPYAHRNNPTTPDSAMFAEN
jgi:hypothetical protein